jgi:ubiquinone/menaquinone biosynthesis C-methylase UbiE
VEDLYRPGIGSVQRYRFRCVLRALPDQPVERLLEIGYGSGVLQYSVASLAGMAVGLDVHACGSEVRSRLASDGLHPRLLKADGSSLPFPAASFDVVVAVSALEFMRDPGACLRESRRVLRPGGRLVLVTPRPVGWADRLYRMLTGLDPETNFRGGRQRVQAALAADLPGARRAPRPSLIPLRFAPYEIVVWTA